MREHRYRYWVLSGEWDQYMNVRTFSSKNYEKQKTANTQKTTMNKRMYRSEHATPCEWWAGHLAQVGSVVFVERIYITATTEETLDVAISRQLNHNVELEAFACKVRRKWVEGRPSGGVLQLILLNCFLGQFLSDGLLFRFVPARWD